MHSLHIATDCLGAKRHRSINPDPDRGGRPSLEVPTKTGRNLDRGFDTSAPQPPVEIGVVGNGCLLDEIARSSEPAEIGATLGRLITIEDRERKVVDVGRDAETENEHEECGTEQSKRQPDRIAQELECFARAVRKHPAEAEQDEIFSTPSNWGWGRAKVRLDGVNDSPTGPRGRLGAVGLLEVADEGLFQGCTPRACTSAAGTSVASTLPSFIREIRSQRAASFMK